PRAAAGGLVLPGYARGAVVLAIAALPLLTPSFAGNAGPVDLFIVLAVGCVLFAACSQHVVARLPLALPVWLSIIAGALGAAAHDRLQHSKLLLAQDLLMLLWGGAVATAAQHGPTLSRLMRWWTRVGVASALLLIIGVVGGIKKLSGYTPREADRAAFLFGDPNRCGLYLMLAFLIMRAAQYPNRPIVRSLCCATVLVAMLLTGSNAAIAGLAVAVVIAAFISAGRRGGVVKLVAVGAIATLLAGAAVLSLDLGRASDSAGGVGILANNLGRAAKSTDSRSTILQENWRLYLENDLFGLGPDGTKDTLKQQGAGYVKEAHNDYIAAANERGVLGMAALLLFIALVGARAARLMGLRPPRQLTEHVPRPDILGATAIGVAVTAAFHQTLHFRHEWAYFGLLAGAALLAVRGREPS
ncbi:MAG: O-antigen ligase family protein, partial [Catenulispora sp.]|nr:O-antigen ligase family protein [Catenulispora sp.]